MLVVRCRHAGAALPLMTTGRVMAVAAEAGNDALKLNDVSGVRVSRGHAASWYCCREAGARR